MIRKIPITIFIFILFFSCKKDNNVGYPTVSILAPAALTTFNVFDTVTIKASASDASKLQSVQVYVINSQNTPVLPSYSVPITGSSMTFSVPYILNNIHLASGTYNIVVDAYNGTNDTKAYRQIYIDAVPTVREAVYAITRNHSGIHLWKLDSLFNVTLSATQGGDYSSSDISAYYQQLYISAADSGNVTAYAVPVGSQIWTVPGIISSTPYFTNVYAYGDAVYASYYNDYVKYYNNAGAIQSNTATATGYYPIKTCIWSNYLFVEEKYISSTIRNLVLFYAATGGAYQQSNLPGPVVAMYGMDYNDVFVFGNTNSGTGYLQQYNISGNLFYSPVVMPSAKILSVAQIDTQTYLVGFDNGSIYLYTYNPNSIAPYINGITASHLQYDVANNMIIASSGTSVYEYNYSTLGLVHTANLGDSVLNVHVLYNH